MALALLGCSARPATIGETVETPPAFTVRGTEAVPDRWWTTFGDPGLDAAVDEALAGNLDLIAAWHRLRAADAAVDVERGDLSPALDAFATARLDESDARRGDPEDVEIGLAASYEVDLFGRISSAVDAERFRAQASAEDYRAVALTLSAEVARTWYRLAEARLQRALILEQVQTNQELLVSLENRFGLGQVRAVDVLRQQRLLAATEEEIARAERRIGTLENRLAVLLGRSPQDGVALEPDALPELAPLPDTGLPSELVRRRPDVRRAHAELLAADRDVATAISNRYPRLSLGGSAAVAADDAGRLFRDWAASLLGDLVAPLFAGGALRAEVERTEAVEQAELAEYGRAILEAFREVEDALVEEAAQRDAIHAIDRQVELAETAQEQLRQQFFYGSSDYLDALIALDDLQELKRDRLAAELDLVEIRVALYRALAGAFDTGRETPATESTRAAAGDTDEARGTASAVAATGNGA